MANVLHRTTKQYLISVNEPDYPTVDWIHNPDLSVVAGFASIYWTITGDTVTLQSPAERTATDAAIAAAALAARRAEAVAKPDEVTALGVEVRALIELFNKRDNYLTTRIVELQDALDAVKASSGPADNIRNAIPATWLATNTRARPAAITDYKDNINAGGSD